MKNRIVILVGGKRLPLYLENLLIDYDRREDANFCEHIKEEDYDCLIQGYKAHKEISIGKVKQEASERKLYDRVVFLHKDYVDVEVSPTVYNFLKSDFYLEPNTLYTPLYTEIKEVSKSIIVPSTKVWMCDSLTHNIISTMPTYWLERDMLEFYMDQDKNYGYIYKAFKHRQFQFFNFLGSMNIRIKTI